MIDPKASKEQSLARIRENQRRSRARRKEYIHELEAKIRSNEQRQLAASIEIQKAARKVAEENRRLRGMLHARGVTERDIEFALGETSAAPDLMSLVLPKTNHPPNPALVTEREASSPIPDATEDRPAPSLLPKHQAAMKRGRPCCNRAPIIPAPSSGQMAASNPSANGGPSLEAEPIDGTLDSYRHKNGDLVPVSRAIYANDPNSTSCVSAAHIIRTMQSDVGPELEAELGCMPGQDCRISNPVVFEVIDKYSNPVRR